MRNVLCCCTSGTCKCGPTRTNRVKNPLIVGPTPNSVKCPLDIDTRVTGRTGFGKSYGELLALETDALRVTTVLCPTLHVLASVCALIIGASIRTDLMGYHLAILDNGVNQHYSWSIVFTGYFSKSAQPRPGDETPGDSGLGKRPKPQVQT